MSKPRQFWIAGLNDYEKIIFDQDEVKTFKHHFNFDGRYIHVIEFSAYQSAIEELKAAKEALDTCYMQFADRIARVKAPESYMLEECQQARLRIDKFLKEIE